MGPRERLELRSFELNVHSQILAWFTYFSPRKLKLT
jgi:hypothetical protein